MIVTSMNQYFVYILLCSDNTFYTGITNNLERRLSKHNHKFYPNSYTSKRTPVTLVWSGIFNDIRQAKLFEQRIKKWSRAKKEALIKNDWERIKQLSKRKTPDKK